ncbi:PLP-dependent cysteine synthase family protein [Paeniglutamicibacter sp. Y32M11]|uniref:PLP-dependent cysteine synthase family protein n=1 Tax=Paeniglutamicibacter sp. Y32M11 TaxID=2853258 RepID=UPI001C528ACE|nr:PLP-dependent cysteine synthase family protein [Paeniglutamicibacter sp. Y32M11]
MRSADTHLHKLSLPAAWGIDLYLKDESTHRTGSLKHRLARSLFLYGLVNGWITEGTTIVEASSGSTAVSEAYYAQLLGLPFIAVMSAGTSPEKISLIEATGGTCHLVEDPSSVYAESEQLAAATGGHYMDQFTYAERATDWRGNNNIAESIFGQLAAEEHPIPSWIVVGAGTGGTSATIGRYARYHRHPTRLAVADPQGSAFLPAWEAHHSGGNPRTATGTASRIEGIGRARPEPSFVPGIIDFMATVPDAASVAAMRHLSDFAALRSGPSTGTNLWLAWQIIASMLANGERGSVVTLLCDSGDRYATTYYNDAWLASAGLDPAEYDGRIQRLLGTGRWN